MTQAIAKYAAKKMLSGEMNKYKEKKAEGDYDPFYTMVPNPKKPGKFKKVKKQVPYYIPAHDADVLARARKSAYRLDFALFNFLGFRFGWASVIGIVPLIGDGADGLLALNLIRKMHKVEGGLPRNILITMLINLIIDVVVGLVPFVGDLADAAYKCNGKNVRLLEKHLDKKYKPTALIEEEKRLKRQSAPATAFEDFSDEEEERRNTFDDRHDNVRQPTRAYSGRREREPDVEMGLAHNDTSCSHKNKSSRHEPKTSRRH